MHRESDVVRERKKTLGETLEHGDGLAAVHALVAAEPRELRFSVRRTLLHELTQSVAVSEIEDANSAASDFVLVRGADTAPRRTDRLARVAFGVDKLVVRKHEMRTVAHIQAALDIHAVADETVDLREERIRIENHPIADRAANTWVKNAARDLVQDEGGIPDVYRMACVRSALVANDPIRALGEDVDELSLSLVAPLCADDDERTCVSAEHE
jgi:hypothetical protein